MQDGPESLTAFSASLNGRGFRLPSAASRWCPCQAVWAGRGHVGRRARSGIGHALVFSARLPVSGRSGDDPNEEPGVEDQPTPTTPGSAQVRDEEVSGKQVQRVHVRHNPELWFPGRSLARFSPID